MKYKLIILACFVVWALGATVLAQTKDDVRPVVDDSKKKPETSLNPKLPTLYIVGDSTLKSDAPLRGWGQELGAFLIRTRSMSSTAQSAVAAAALFKTKVAGTKFWRN